MNTAWLFGGCDMARWIAFKTGERGGFCRRSWTAAAPLCGGLFERPFVSWRNDVALFMGPRLSGYSAVDIEDLTEVEIRSHRLMAQHLEVYRAHAPGFENAFLMLSAPQIGVRHARRLAGVARVTRERMARRRRRGRTRSACRRRCRRNMPPVSVPYGCLVPRDAGRAAGGGAGVSCDATSHSFLREIPQCWLTGQAAGRGGGTGGRRAGDAAGGADCRQLQEALARQGALVRAAVSS